VYSWHDFRIITKKSRLEIPLTSPFDFAFPSHPTVFHPNEFPASSRLDAACRLFSRNDKGSILIQHRCHDFLLPGRRLYHIHDYNVYPKHWNAYIMHIYVCIDCRADRVTYLVVLVGFPFIFYSLYFSSYNRKIITLYTYDI
jgi:hypothetical protein